jgi:DNA-directed RNA polymerase specialized sigma24 family protein
MEETRECGPAKALSTSREMTMDDTVQWLHRFTAGDEAAVVALWDRYQQRLLQLARQRLGGRYRRSADEEDVALSAFKSFCLGAAAGAFSDLEDRQSVWKLLVTLTLRKANAELRRQFAAKRGGGAVGGESFFLAPEDSGSSSGLQNFPDGQPPPDLAVLMSQECERLLECLEDETLQRIAFGKLEGYTNEELAKQLDCSAPTVERKLARIRKIWQKQADV